MTVSEALKSIHKKRCAGASCARCEYLATVCDDPEIVEIVKTLRIMPLSFIESGGMTIGIAADGSGSVIYPKGAKPPEPTFNAVDIGLFDEE